MNFWKSFFASLLALVLFSVISLVLVIGFFVALSSEKEVIVRENSVLHLKLDNRISELEKDDPFESLPIPGAEGTAIGLMQLKQAIAHAKTDDKIKGIYLECGFPQAGFSTIEEIRQSLIDFRSSGKWVVAYTEVMSEGAYYLATAADEIYLNPLGEIEFNGLTVEVSFFKKLFDKLEINPQIFRVGEFKSAVEPFMRDSMSPENELQLSELIRSIHDHMVGEVSKARELPVERVREISDNMMARNARTAVELGLVDSLLYSDEFHQNIMKRLGVDDEKDINFIKYNKYRKSYSAVAQSKNEIAVIVAEGTIMPGESVGQEGVVGGDTFVKEIRKARKNSRVKAIVLRINSPGGDVRASDMIWREIEMAKKEKPVIASMGDLAASGGYYIAMGCDTIVAQPNTITGSIGIFGMMFDMSSFLGNKIGITFDEVKTGKYGEMYTVSRPLTEAERGFWQRILEDYYDIFVTKAADGRNLKKEEILSVASGRVWTGSQSLSRKLVDVEGGFNDAVQIAAASAGIGDDYKLKYYPQPKGFLQAWLSQAEEDASARQIKSELGEYYIWYEQLQRIKTYQGAQARLPFEMQIH